MAIIDQLGMTVQTCIECGMVFAVPTTWDNKRREDHAIFCCPNGHKQHYNGETRAERLEREKRQLAERLDHEKRCCIAAREEANHIERRLWGMKGQLVRVKKQMKQTA